MNGEQLINKKLHIIHRNKILKDKERFIFNEIGQRINLSLESINLSLNNCLEIGIPTLKIYKYIITQFREIDYYAIDISNNILKSLPNKINRICMDHDSWQLEKKFDLIISNHYLHATNNFEILLNNINQVLNDKGFFIATIPSQNSFHELKDCMIEADISMYEGAYKRFIESFSVNYIIKMLKKNGFKKPVIEIDTINLMYKKFSSLLNDIRFLGNSNIYKDRKKKFEKKTYFNKVEEIYWKKYSNNNQLISQLEMIYITAWKK